MVTSQAIFTIINCAADQCMEVAERERSSEVINGVLVVSENAFPSERGQGMSG